MPSITAPLHPTQLASLNPAMSSPAPTQAPQNSGPSGHPNMLAALNPRMAPPSAPGMAPTANPYAYTGNQNPGAFVTPAPFNPMLAMTLLSQNGALSGTSGGTTSGRGPVGGFGVGTSPNPLLNPRSKNPYVGGF